ncbi:MAG: DUF2892 domain-containing protein [Candidatus Levybacteria bacterium]|nr:DUF2892 domain-containing protein [Candidatus Levybacteria bacterium]
MLIKIYKLIPLALIALFVSIFVLAPSLAYAHQPRITESRQNTVPDPEISKAYYATLTGEPDVYLINAPAPFDLYVGILVPDITSTKKDILAEIFKDKEKIATIGGASSTWKPFFEPFGQSNYFDGGEYKARAEAGVYTIKVSNPLNTGKYSLAIGEIEAFDGKEGMNALSMIPDLKRDFFEESPISFILSPFGWGLLVIMYLLAFIVGFIYRAILKKFAKGTTRGTPRNIGKPDRLLRAVIGVALLLWAITTTWSPILIFFSGFAIFEAIFSWCGFYAAMGRNTCPVE